MNILLTTLSTFGSYTDINSYTYNGTKKPINLTGYHSAEAAIKTLIEILSADNEKLDKIIMLCSDRVISESKSITDEIRRNAGLSADCEKITVEKYVEQCVVNYLKENHCDLYTQLDFEQLFKRIKIENRVVDASAETIEEIQVLFKNEKQKHLYMDAQGGFRDANIVITSVLQLLQIDGIKPKNIFLSNYDKDAHFGEIFDKNAEYSIIGFASGIDEFINYGRAKLLNEYFKKMPYYNSIEHILKTIKNIADAIQFCNFKSFTSNLKKFNVESEEYLSTNENSDALFRYTLKKIHEDYSNLLKVDGTAPPLMEIVKWCRRKEFYQQAITFLEDQLPHELLRQGALFREDDIDKHIEIIKERKEEKGKKLHNGYKSNEKYFIDDYLPEIEGMIKFYPQNGIKIDTAKELLNKYRELHDLRNKINHGSCKKSAAQIKKDLDNMIKFIIEEAKIK